MQPNHHPDASTLAAYAAGSVTEGFSLVLAAHLEFCGKCRSDVSAAEQMGGDLLNRLPPVEMAGDDLPENWESASSQTAPRPLRTKPTAGKGLPVVLGQFFPDGLEGIRWRTLVPGIQQHLLTGVDSGAGSVRMLRIAKGVKVPHHTHLGSELTFILQGSYEDELGHFERGDLSDADSSVQHQPVVDSEQACVCLIATDQRLKFTHRLSRMIQPLMHI